MDSKSAFLLSAIICLLLFFLGPIALIPITACIVFFNPVARGDVPANLAGIDKIFVGTILASFALAFFAFFIFDNADLVELIKGISTLAILPTAHMQLIQLNDANGLVADSAAFAITIYLVSLALFFPVSFQIISRLRNFQNASQSFFRPLETVGIIRILAGLLILIILLFLIYFAIYYLLTTNDLKKVSYKMYILSSAIWLILSTLDFLFWQLLRQISLRVCSKSY